jgi:hypothetical protein
VQLFETKEGREALRELGVGLEQVGKSLRRLATLGEPSASTTSRGADAGLPQEREIALLFRRLGQANQAFLWELAQTFRPGDAFSLEEAARQLGIRKESARARMANIGRSTKSMGANAPILWDVEWDDGENSYEWDFDSHRAILRLGGE